MYESKAMVMGEDNFTISVYRIQVLVLSPKGFAAESFNMLDPLAGQYGFDGGMLPGGRRERASTENSAFPGQGRGVIDNIVSNVVVST